MTKIRNVTLAAAAALVLSPAAVFAQDSGRPYLREMNGPDDVAAAPQVTERAPPSGQGRASDAYRPSAAEPGSSLQAPPAARPQRPNGPATAMRENIPAPVDKGDLAPIIAGDGSNLPMDLWTGMNFAGFEKLLSEIVIPPRSAAVHDLWKRLILSKAAPPGGSAAGTFEAVRLEALYRSGLAAEAAAEMSKEPQQGTAVLSVLAARNELANANRTKACELAGQASTQKGDVPKAVKAQSVLLNGYCSAASGDAAGAGLAAELAREEGLEQSAGLAVLDAISINAKPKVKIDGTLSLLDYRLLEIAGAPPEASALDKAEPALLVALTNDSASKPELRLAAAEAAARLNAIPPDALAAIYSALAPKDAAQAQAQTSTPLKRAALFKAIESERTAGAKVKLMQALIEDARRVGLGFQAMRLVARACAQIKPELQLASFIDTGAEIGLASGNFELVRAWVALAGRGAPGESAAHWLALADIADVSIQPHGAYLNELEALALRNAFKPETLHRLATVLEALDYLVPIPLWDAAGRTPQPTGGYLPETGVLPALQEASKKKEFAHTVLLVMQTLGPDGPEAANLIALGDSIRALKRAGLEADARRMGLEALLGSWPHAQ